ncbi:MAG: cadherin-like beta sandwich domain-containing protein, partial [bacterium]
MDSIFSTSSPFERQNETDSAPTAHYTSSVPYGTSSVTVTPTAAQANATIQARVGANAFASVTSGNPSASLPLAYGANTIEVKVTAQDGTTIKTYTITV